MNIKVILEVTDEKDFTIMEGSTTELMAVLTRAMCQVLHQSKKLGIPNYVLACDVAGAVRMGLDQMERDEKREGKVVFV